MSDTPIDQVGSCDKCGCPVEHVAGVPGSQWHTPYWRHTGSGPHPHPAVPNPDTIEEAA